MANSGTMAAVAILGGTGEQGRGLGWRFALAGHRVVLGSRDPARAYAAAQQIQLLDPRLDVQAGDNRTAARAGDVVVVAVPYAGHGELLADLAAELAGKVVVDCVNPLAFDRQGARPIAVPEGSAAEQAASVLVDSRVVAAFHHVSATLLLAGSGPVDTDVLVAGDDREATDVVIGLAGGIAGMRGVYAGPLRLARELEGMTAVLIAVNRRYKIHAGLRVTDL